MSTLGFPARVFSGYPNKEKNSVRVAWLLRKVPNMAEVFIEEFCFSTPRIIIHMCLASIITPTPCAFVTS